MNSKSWISICLAGGVLMLGTAQTHAAYPDHPVHLIVGFNPGGSTDNSARLVANGLAEKWNQPVVVENKAGADSTIAGDVVAHAPADGYTLLWASNAHTIAAGMYKLNYDSLKSFAPISEIGYVPDLLLVNSSLPVNSLSDLIALAKSKPGQLNFASPGTASSPFLEMALLMKLTGIKMTNVNYKGGAPAMVGLLGSEVQVMFGSVSVAISQVKSGKLKALAIAGAVRSPLIPEVPTIAEVAHLQGFETSSPWNGLMAPAGTPKPIIDKLHTDMVAVVKTDAAQKSLAEQGYVTIADDPEHFTKTVAGDISRWGELLKTVDTK